MILLISIPMLLSSLVLAAHFFRSGNLVLVLIYCALPLILAIRRSWTTRIVQLFLFIGALEWVRALLEIAAVRRDEGLPWHRMAIILGSVAAFTALSGLLLFLFPNQPGSATAGGFPIAEKSPSQDAQIRL